jgi:hypothetical protein
MGMFYLEIYHNVGNTRRYEAGDRLHLVASHWIRLPVRDMRQVADWAAEPSPASRATSNATATAWARTANCASSCSACTSWPVTEACNAPT